MKVGDLVKHKHLGGLGLIVGKKNVVSNITMGTATKFTVKWLVHTSYPRECYDYFPAFLELSDQADKNCPSET